MNRIKILRENPDGSMVVLLTPKTPAELRKERRHLVRNSALFGAFLLVAGTVCTFAEINGARQNAAKTPSCSQPTKKTYYFDMYHPQTNGLMVEKRQGDQISIDGRSLEVVGDASSRLDMTGEPADNDVVILREGTQLYLSTTELQLSFGASRLSFSHWKCD